MLILPNKFIALYAKKGTLYKYPFDAYYYAIDTNAVLSKIYEKNSDELFIY